MHCQCFWPIVVVVVVVVVVRGVVHLHSQMPICCIPIRRSKPSALENLQLMDTADQAFTVCDFMMLTP